MTAATRVKRAWLTAGVPLLMLLAGLLKGLATWIYQMNQQALSQWLAKHFRDRLFESLLTLPFSVSGSRPPGEWMSVIMNDVYYLQTRFSEMISSLIKDGVLILSALAAIAVLHPPTALGLLLAAPFLAMGMGRTGNRIAAYATAWQQRLGIMAASILDIRGRFEFILAQGGQKTEMNRFQQINDEYYQMIRRSLFVRSAFAPWLEFLGFLVFAGFIWYLAGDDRSRSEFGPAGLVQFFAALGVLLRPLRNFGEQFTRFRETTGALRTSLETMAQGVPDEAAIPMTSPATLPGSIGIRRLEAGYGGRVFFRGENLSLQAGRSVAIVGPSGAGKSTLIRTLAGIYRPLVWEGSLPAEQVGGAASLVSQVPFLFGDSLRVNLLYGSREDAPGSDERLWEVLEKVGIHNEIRALPEGLGSAVEPVRGNLSGGQVQRLVIARALLRDAPLLLFDEATSAIDEASASALTSLMIRTCHREEKYFVAVTHRPGDLPLYDEVWFLAEGAMIARGSHDDLLKNPRYRRFVEGADT